MTQMGTETNTRDETAGLDREGTTPPRLFGIVELDPAGTVLYTRFDPDGAPQGQASNYMGLNFYTEVAPFRNVGEFRELLDTFRQGLQPAYSTNFNCDYEDGPLLVRLLFARIRERTQTNATKSILVHIRRAP